MVIYNCEKCGKEFKKKGYYDKHINQKKSCVFENKLENNTDGDNENTKKTWGQFYTTNCDYILQNMHIPDNINDIIEPFAGNCDLLNIIKDKTRYNIECYDIDPKKDDIIRQDTLLNPPDFNNKYVITNPPYLARNRSTNKLLFDKYNTNDLYKCFIKILISSNCIGGILIVPLNFICSIRISDIELRKLFIMKYDIITINIFEEQVFNDTSYSVCSFQFKLKENDKLNDIDCFIYPSSKKIVISLNSDNNYTIGGEIYNLNQNTNYTIQRATKINKEKNLTNILVKCIDDSIKSKISLTIINDNDKDKYIDNSPNLSARSYALLIIEPNICIENQTKLVNKFNSYLNEKRDKYNSLFLTNYRDSNTIARKRISFNLVYELCNYLLDKL